MTSSTAAWGRVRKMKAFSRMQESDFRPIVFNQAVTVAAGQTSSAQAQNFPGGAIILGICANCYVNAVAPATGQSSRNRQLFGLNFAYTNNESLTPGGPVNADALLGGGDDTIFPSRELIIAPNQAIQMQAANYTTSSLVIHVVYHCLVYRYAS